MSPLASALQRYRSSALVRRISGGAGAALYGRLTVLAIQLLSIPILTNKWGAEGYGIWVLLTTVPFYLAMSDFGLGAAASVEITVKLGDNDKAGARTAFQSVWLFLTSISTTILLIAGVVCGYFYIAGGTADGPWTIQTLALATLLMISYSCGVVQMTIVMAVYRATHKFAMGRFIINTMLLVEGCWLLGSVYLGGDLLMVVIGYNVLRMIGMVFYSAILARYEDWFDIGGASADLATIKRLARPSIANLAQTLANTMILQVLMLTLAFVAGPSAVATFSATRFLTRVPFQFFLMFGLTSVPEYTHAQLAGKWNLVMRLVRFNLAVGLAASVVAGVVVTYFGSMILGFISYGLEPDWRLFLLLSLAVIFGVVWNALSNPLVAANEAERYAYKYTAVALLVVLSPFLLWLFPGRVEPSVFAAAMQALAELVMVLVLFREFPAFLKRNGVTQRLRFARK